MSRMTKAKKICTRSQVLAMLSLMLSAVPSFAASQFESFQTHSHFVFNADPETTYTLEAIQSNGKQVGLRLKVLNAREDGSPFSAMQDERTSKVQVFKSRGESGFDVTYEFLFSERAQKAGMDYFEYRSKSPNQILLDYWFKQSKEKTNAQLNDAAGSKKNTVAVNEKKHGEETSVESNDSTTKVKASKNAVGMACGKIDASHDGIVHYNNYHRYFAYRDFFDLAQADAHYAYPQLNADLKTLDENKRKEVAHYQLAHKLFKESKFALTLRTIDFFESRYPQSELKGELDFLRASTFLKLSKLLKTDRYYEQALEIYRQHFLTDLDKPRGRAALAFLVQEYMHSGRPVVALEYTLRGAELAPLEQESDSKLKSGLAPWVYRLASAEALFQMRELDRSERSYQLILDQKNAFSAEAAFRIGEVYAARGFLDRAILAFEKAIREFPKDANDFPAAWFNLGQAYFETGKLDESARVFQEYLKRFPHDEFAWAGKLRLTDIEQMQMAAGDNQKGLVIRKMLETVVNRHPYSAGAMLAELRLSECVNAGSRSSSEANFFAEFFKNRELKKFESPLLKANEIEIWFDLAQARFYLSQGNPVESLKLAADYASKLPKLALKDAFKKVFSDAVLAQAQLYTKPDTKEAAQALIDFSEKYAAYAPNPGPFSYELAQLRASEKLNDLSKANKQFLALEARLSEATDAEKDTYFLLKGRNYRKLGKNPDLSIVEFSRIRDQGDLNALKLYEISKSSLEKADLQSTVRYDGRLLDTKLASKLTLDKQIEVQLRYLESFSTLNSAPGDGEKLARLCDHAILKYGTFTEFQDQLLRVRELRAQGLYEAAEYKKAAEAFHEILSFAPEHPRKAQIEFQMGKSLTHLGKNDEAFETFRKLAGASKDDVWKKSAQAELDQLQWDSKIDEYMNKQNKDRRSDQ